MERTTQLVGQATSFLDAVERASRAAPLDRPVLVIGERGTGKELIAERLHHLSSRWDGPLITLNCAALPETLIEAELFGHEAGAFTGATKARQGRFEEADGGTLFLDELATLSSPAQDRLLRAIEYGEVTRIGASRPVRVDVRIVAATNEHLPRLVEEGRFRADLLDRLSFEVVTLPPLRHRESDIPVLADHFGRRHGAGARMGQLAGFSKAAQRRSDFSNGPATARAAQRCRRAVYRWGVGQPDRRDAIRPFASPWPPTAITASAEAPPPSTPLPMGRERRAPDGPFAALRPSPVRSGPCADFRLAVAEYEKAILAAALEKCRWNQRQAAQALKLSYDQLRHALRRHELQ
jgi:psp operon transcriptional activator